ncbi:MAG: AAA family ATPase [Methylocella sp.]
MAKGAKDANGDKSDRGSGADWCIDMSEWDDETPPLHERIVPGLIPAKAVTILSGDGGPAPPLALLLCGAMALDGDWIGRKVKPGRTLYLSAEDDADDLHGRIAPIRVAYGASFKLISGFLCIKDLVGTDDAVLVACPHGVIQFEC